MSESGPPPEGPPPAPPAPPAPVDRWQSLVNGAFLLEEGRGPEGCSDAQVLQFLDSVLEVFNADADPVEDWEGYAVRRMTLALRRAIGER